MITYNDKDEACFECTKTVEKAEEGETWWESNTETTDLEAVETKTPANNVVNS